ncbi:MAG: SgcJ/EcaC family oxidoreductase [Actinomycetota bacterium]
MDHQADEGVIRAVEAAYDAAWGAGDVESLLACLTDEAVLVSPRGDLVRGHTEIGRELTSLLAGPVRGSAHMSRIIRVEFVTDDVAVVDGEATVDPAGEAEGTGIPLVHRFTDIFVRRSGTWAIAHIRAYVLAG